MAEVGVTERAEGEQRKERRDASSSSSFLCVSVSFVQNLEQRVEAVQHHDALKLGLNFLARLIDARPPSSFGASARSRRKRFGFDCTDSPSIEYESAEGSTALVVLQD